MPSLTRQVRTNHGCANWSPHGASKDSGILLGSGIAHVVIQERIDKDSLLGSGFADSQIVFELLSGDESKEAGDIRLHGSQIVRAHSSNAHIAYHRVLLDKPGILDVGQPQLVGRYGRGLGIAGHRYALEHFDDSILADGHCVHARHLPGVVDLDDSTGHDAGNGHRGVSDSLGREGLDIAVGDRIAGAGSRFGSGRRPVDRAAGHGVIAAHRICRTALFDFEHFDHSRVGQCVRAAGICTVGDLGGFLGRRCDAHDLRQRRAVQGNDHLAIASGRKHMRFRSHSFQVRIDGQTQALILFAFNLVAAHVGQP